MGGNMAKQISEERKIAYYLGIGLMVIGALLFLSVFISVAMSNGNVDCMTNLHSVADLHIKNDFASDISSYALRSIFGLTLFFIGMIVKNIGARGLAGSGVMLDPEKAREDFEPYSRMAGGMVKDALDEAKVSFDSKPEKVVMVKCRGCGKLNPEDAKFCNGCGREL